MEEQIKQNFSRNLSILRKGAGLTQAQLAEKLNYSDKSISKWERGEVLPDIITLTMVAQYFGITLDNLIGNEQPKKEKIRLKRNLITTMSCCLAIFVACLAFLICKSLEVKNSWMIFIYALPCASIIAIVFSCVWYPIFVQAISVSVLVWLVGLAVYLSLLCFLDFNLWFIFIVCLVFQILVFLWFFYRAKRK